MGAKIRLFGEAAFELGYVTTGQLYEALTIQARQEAEGTAPRRFLGEILVDLGYMNEKQMLEVLTHLHPSRRTPVRE